MLWALCSLPPGEKEPFLVPLAPSVRVVEDQGDARRTFTDERHGGQRPFKTGHRLGSDRTERIDGLQLGRRVPTNGAPLPLVRLYWSTPLTMK